MPVKRLGFFCIFFGLAVLAGSYLIIAFDYKTLFLGNIPVHEDGRHTFWQTVFYTGHFLREIPICLMMALSIAGAWNIHGMAPLENRGFRKKLFWAGLAGVSFIFLFSFFKTVSTDGLRSAMLDLAQYKTREYELVYGSHWRSHFFHVLFIYASATSLALALRGIWDYPAVSSSKKNLWRFHLAAFLFFALLNIIFPPNSLIFNDTRYLAHQLREIVTHTLLTLPFALGTLFLIEQKIFKLPSKSSKRSFHFRRAALWAIPAFAVFFTVLFQLYGRPILAAADQQARFANLFAAHNFEHSLDYAFVVFLVLLLASKAR